MDEVIVCDGCASNEFVIGTSGVRCAMCGVFVTYDEAAYEIIAPKENDKWQELKSIPKNGRRGRG